MVYRINALRGTRVAAKDRPAGVLNDVVLDDRNWRVRYLAIDNGGRSPGRRLVKAASATLHADGQITLALTQAELKRSISVDANPHLLGARELSGYVIHGSQGAMALVEDVLLRRDWSVAGLVAWSGNWLLPGRHVEIAMAAIDTIERPARVLRVHLTGKQLRGAPGASP